MKPLIFTWRWRKTVTVPFPCIVNWFDVETSQIFIVPVFKFSFWKELLARALFLSATGLICYWELSFVSEVLATRDSFFSSLTACFYSKCFCNSAENRSEQLVYFWEMSLVKLKWFWSLPLIAIIMIAISDKLQKQFSFTNKISKFGHIMWPNLGKNVAFCFSKLFVWSTQWTLMDVFKVGCPFIPSLWSPKHRR